MGTCTSAITEVGEIGECGEVHPTSDGFEPSVHYSFESRLVQTVPAAVCWDASQAIRGEGTARVNTGNGCAFCVTLRRLISQKRFDKEEWTVAKRMISNNGASAQDLDRMCRIVAREHSFYFRTADARYVFINVPFLLKTNREMEC